MVAEPKVRIAWSPRGNRAQVRLLKCQVFEIFFGGARGGGKTDGVLGEFGAHASRYGKDAIGLMVRRTRAELVETIERSREIYGPLGWQLNEFFTRRSDRTGIALRALTSCYANGECDYNCITSDVHAGTSHPVLGRPDKAQGGRGSSVSTCAKAGPRPGFFSAAPVGGR